MNIVDYIKIESDKDKCKGVLDLAFKVAKESSVKFSELKVIGSHDILDNIPTNGFNINTNNDFILIHSNENKPVKFVREYGNKCPIIYEITNGETHSICNKSMLLPKGNALNPIMTLTCMCDEKDRNKENCLYEKYFKEEI